MSTPNASGWKPGTPVTGHNAMSGPDTATGNRALMLEEPLLFEIGHVETTGVDLPEPQGGANRLGGFDRTAPIGLPGLSEPETVRHYTRLSRQNYAIDLGLFPLGSCTMKHNPRLNEKVARMPGFADVHPLQPVDTVRGALEVIAELAFGCRLPHARRRDEPQGGRAWRIVRHPVHPRRARSARRCA